MMDLKKERPHILLARTDKPRDVLLSLPMATALRQKYPDAQISILISKDSYDIAKMCPDVDKIFIYDPVRQHKGFRGFWKLVKKFKNQNIDVAIAVYPHFFIALLFLYLMIPLRIGTSRRFYSFLFNYRIRLSRKSGGGHETTYNLKLLLPFGVDLSVKDRIYPNYSPRSESVHLIDAFLNSNSVESYMVINPTFEKIGPIWPLSYIEDLIYLILKRINISIVVTGTLKDQMIFDKIKNDIVERLSMAEKKKFHFFLSDQVEQQAALLQKAKLLVSTYNGCHHLAVALGINAIVLFPLSPGLSEQRYAAYGPGRFIVFKPDLVPCKRCVQSKCEYKNCLSYIFPDILLQEIQKFLLPEDKSSLPD